MVLSKTLGRKGGLDCVVYLLFDDCFAVTIIVL